MLYGYDAAGNRISVTSPRLGAHSFEYNAVGLMTEYRPPQTDASDPSTTYAYNLDRALAQVHRPDSVTIDFGYDAAGRLDRVTFPGGLLEYGYDPVTGRLTGISGPYAGTLTMSYDGPLLTGVNWLGEVTGSISAVYDSQFRVSELRVNGQDPVTFGYDGDGLLVEAGALGVARDPASGRLTGTTLGDVTSSQEYNAFGELASLDWRYGGARMLLTSYIRDALGRIETRADVVGTDTTTWSYSYDPEGRLATVARDGVAEATYGYDQNGNRTIVTGPGGVVEATYDAQDRLLTYGSSSYAYTPGGELRMIVSGTDTTSYTYDVLGNLLAVDVANGTRIEYVVDPVGRRIGRNVDGARDKGWLYQDGLNPIAELDESGNVVSRFVYGPLANVPAYIVKGGLTYRVISDALGSVRMVVDVASGTVAQELAYDPWGQVLVDTNPGFQPFGYAGGLYDPATGLVRFGVRDYDSHAGRWTRSEPLGFAGGSTNLWVYSLSDPVNTFDMTGLSGILDGVQSCSEGVFSYVKGLTDYARHWGRRLGLLGECEKRQAALEDRLMEEALDVLLESPMARELAREAVKDAIADNKVFVVCRLVTGGFVSFGLGPIGGGLAVAAGFGGAHRAVESGVESAAGAAIDAVAGFVVPPGQ